MRAWDGWQPALRIVVSFASLAIAAWLAFTLRRVLLVFFAGFVLAAGIAPIADRLQRAGVPRGASVLAPFAALFAATAAVAAAIAVPLGAEAEAFARYVQSTGDVPLHRALLLDAIAFVRPYVPAVAFLEDHLARAADQVAGEVTGGGTSGATGSQVLSGLTRATAGVAGAAFALLFAFVIALYLLWDRERVRRYLLSLIPAAGRPAAASFADRATARVGGWALGQATLCAIVGLSTYAALLLIGVPYALALALFAAFAELLPLVGPISAAVLGVAAASSQSLPQALAALAFYLVFQQVDSYLLAPRVLGAAVRIHPLAVLVAVGVGAELLGIAGALLAPPAATIIAVLLNDWRRRTE